MLPLLYLHGLSSSDFGPALEQFLGSAAGLSAATITRLTAQWQDDAAAFTKRSLKDTDYVYVWVDGIHLKVRLEADKVCLLVMIGVRADGTKELVALADGFRESSQSWADLLRSCRRRGMAAPVLAVGDGALGFWKAVREVFPDTREQRCWFHVSSNVLAAPHPFAQGVAVCLVSDEPGETLTDVVMQVVGMHPTWNLINAQHFVGAAEERYCPDKLPQGAHNPVCSPDDKGLSESRAAVASARL